MRWLLGLLMLLPSLGGAQEFFTLKGHGGPIMAIDVAPSGQIATASFDNSVGWWTGKTPKWFEGHRAAVTSLRFLDDTFLLSGSDDFRLLIWDQTTAAPVEIAQHKGKITDIAINANTITTASWDGSIGQHQIVLRQARPDQSDTLWFKSRSLSGHRSGVSAVAFAGDTLYSASADGTIRQWSNAGSRVVVNNGFGINRIAINAAQNWLAYGAVDGVTRVIDLTSETQIADFTLGRRPVLALALSPDGTQLAVGDGEGYIMVIDTTTWRISRDFRATARGPVWALAFSPDGLNIHAGGLDDTMYSWPVATLDQHDQMTTGERTFLNAPDTMSNGERQFQRKCSICHTLTPGSARRAGPTLFNLFDRRAGTVTDYRYSPILTGSDIIWTDTSIDALFDLGPDHYIPGSKMPMQRITNPDDRADLIGFLRGATKTQD
ncbi:MAG: c-type cytochrome [Sedimentitalea sp.]